MSITYPPEMLPSADGPADVVVVDPVSGERSTIERVSELETALRILLNYTDRYRDQPRVAVAPAIVTARKALKI